VPFVEGKIREAARHFSGLCAPGIRHVPKRTQRRSATAYRPRRGFAFLGSFLTLITSLVLSVVSLLVWPFRMAWLLVSRRQGFRKARIKKLIFLGLDGFDPGLAERYMSEGKLPNLSRLKEQGSYSNLRTTFPALSPVAWSTFATGVNPAKHNIFDFLNRDLKTYVPELSSSKVRPPHRS
jgi:hypothetical protein